MFAACPKLEPLLEHVGLDVAKSSLQLDLAGTAHTLTNDAKGHAQLRKLLTAHPWAHLICEATGGYEKPVVRVLHGTHRPVSIIEAGRVRHFAKAKGLRAKTDLIDATVLSEYGRTFKPAATPAPTAQQARLAELSTRRLQLVDTLTAETNRAEHYTEPVCVKQSRPLVKLLEQQIAACDAQIQTLIAADAVLKTKAERLDAIPGVGQVTAATVLAELPELGRISDEAAAVLVGVAPYN